MRGSMGSAYVRPNFRGQPPGNHYRYLRECSLRKDVLGALVDEFRTSKLCFRCGSDVVLDAEKRIVRCQACSTNSAQFPDFLDRDENAVISFHLICARALANLEALKEVYRPRMVR